MIEEVIRLLTHIDNMFCVCGILLFFIFILVFGYFIGSLVDECVKEKKQIKKEESKALKEEIVKELTSYYESTKENEK